MTEEAKQNSTMSDNYFDYVMKIMEENEEFLRSNAEETYGDVIDLINDAIDLVGFAVESDKSREEYVKHPTFFFLHHILMPSSYAIQTDLLTGNLPVCFMQLRLMLESLAKCYLADLKYPDQRFFQEKLDLLEKETKKKNGEVVSKREHDFIEEFDREFGSNKKSLELWGKLSQDWIHTKGVVNRIVDRITEKSAAPSWAFIIPIKYAETDLDTIEELGKGISQFRSLLKDAIGKCPQE